MALPDPSVTCLEIDIDLDAIFALAIELPGGVLFQPKFDIGSLPDFSLALSKLLGELAAALAPLVPIFRIIEVLLALVDCVKAVQDSLGPPPDPSKMVKCLAKLAKAVSFILKLAPPLSVPIMVKTILDAVILALKGLRAQLEELLTFKTTLGVKADLVAQLLLDPELALGAAHLQFSLDCATANFELSADAVLRGICPINGLLLFLSLLLSLAGLPGIAEIELGADLTAALAPLDAAIELLEGLKLSLPGLPSISLEGC